MSFYYRLDSVMVGELYSNGKAEVGIYAQAYRIMEAFNMFGYMFAGLLLPIFARMIKENGRYISGLLTVVELVTLKNLPTKHPKLRHILGFHNMALLVKLRLLSKY